MGVALSVCTLPGEVPSDRLSPQHMELGLGIVSYLLKNIIMGYIFASIVLMDSF